MKTEIDKKAWEENGFIFFHHFLLQEELEYLQDLCDGFLFGNLSNEEYRSDLSGKSTEIGKEKITQIMLPSKSMPSIAQSSVYKKILAAAQALIGQDAALDFDMIINKLPATEAITPWHQDAAYWPEMVDKRACTFWIALDNVDQENGCMMYVAGSHNHPLRAHEFEKDKGALMTKLDSNDEIAYGAVNAGSVIVHHGHTLHGALGNTSTRQRRAWILNFRPTAMIKELRNKNYDHSGKRKNNAV